MERSMSILRELFRVNRPSSTDPFSCPDMGVEAFNQGKCVFMIRNARMFKVC